MASIALLDDQGKLIRKLASEFPPENICIPQGCKVSWEYQFMDVPLQLQRKMQILKYGTARALLTPYGNTVGVRIESPNARELDKFIEIIILYFADEIHLVDGKGRPEDSLVRGLKNDLRHLSNLVVHLIIRARQTIGLRFIRG